MKKSNWFVCLKYDAFDILLAHDTVSDTGLTKNFDQELLDWLQRFNLEEILQKVFKLSKAEPICTEIAINSLDHDTEQIVVSTSRLPCIVSVEYEDIKPVEGLIKSIMLKYGIFAFRFIDNRIQYIIDLETFLLTYKDNL